MTESGVVAAVAARNAAEEGALIGSPDRLRIGDGPPRPWRSVRAA